MWVYLPNYPFFQEQVVDCLQPNTCLDSRPSATLKIMNTVSKSSKPELGTDTLMTRPSGTTLKHSTGDPGLDAWISSQQDFPVLPFQLQGSKKQKKTTATCGRTPSGLFGRCDHDMRGARTCQVLFKEIMATSDEYLLTFPKVGMMRDGELFQQPTLKRPISGKGCGYWPTPRTCTAMSAAITPKLGMHTFPNLETQVARLMWPTSTSHDHKDTGDSILNGKVKVNGLLGRAVGPSKAKGALNADWVEWLMNWPIGWSSLEPLSQDAFNEWKNANDWWANDPADAGLIPRVTTQAKDRVKRLKAIGNGQVPQCAAMAWHILSESRAG